MLVLVFRAIFLSSAHHFPSFRQLHRLFICKVLVAKVLHSFAINTHAATVRLSEIIRIFVFLLVRSRKALSHPCMIFGYPICFALSDCSIKNNNFTDEIFNCTYRY